MTIEQATKHSVLKPWGSRDLRPWGQPARDGAAIGEIWFERASTAEPEPALLLKLLFTTEPLSIQVHPDDALARELGLENGKSEAWYVLDAVPGARVAVGLKGRATPGKLRAAIEDGSISHLVNWRKVQKDDAVSVPAGTIHAIGAGLVIAEIQQRSDTTFRLFDYGRKREIHLENAVAASDAGPAAAPVPARRLSDCRTLVVAGPHFILERIELAPKSPWSLRADPETWLLAIEGSATVGTASLKRGEALFLQDERTEITAGAGGLTALVAYCDSTPAANLLSHEEWGAGIATTGGTPQPSATATEPVSAGVGSMGAKI